MRLLHFSSITTLVILMAVLIVTGIAPIVSAKKPTLVDGPNNGQHAVLTYDDCNYGPWVGVGTRGTTPNGRTAKAALVNYLQTIDELVKLRATVVIAPTGMCVDMFKKYLKTDIAYYARTHGQYVMSHTYSHRHLSTLTKKQIRWQVSHGIASYWVRPPYGDVNPKVHKVLKSMNRKAWNWTWSSGDWQGGSQQDVVASTVQSCRTGSTCLMHLHANGWSPEAIRQIVQEMRTHGTRVCGLRVNSTGKLVPTTVRWRKLVCTG